MATNKYYLISEDDLAYLSTHLEEDIPYPSARITRTRKQQYLGKSIEQILRPDVLHFALDMEKKLRVHDIDRGVRGWIDEDDELAMQKFLYDRLNEEMIELRKEMFQFNQRNNNKENIAKEAVDIGNFAMMIHATNLFYSPTKIGVIRNLIEELSKDKTKKTKYELPKPPKKLTRFDNLIE